MASENKDMLLGRLRNGEPLSGAQQLRLTMALAVPAILAQLSSVLMQYIDSAMVGRLGAGPSASVGLMASCVWLLNGFTMAVITGFSVQVAHACGAKEFSRARIVMRQGLVTVFLFGLLFGGTGVCLSGVLPGWLGGEESIRAEASAYFLIVSAFMPIGATGLAAAYMLQASGNMKVPSITYVCMGVLDVIFNYLFIFVLDMGVVGAAWGTGLAEASASVFGIWYVTRRSKDLRLRGEKGPLLPEAVTRRKAFRITGPIWLQNVVMRGAYVMSTVIVAPLGAVALAANAFAITAESFCYMPGFGLEEAATTLIGQSLGAQRKDLSRRFAWISMSMGVLIMSALAVVLYILAPAIMGLLSIDPEVVELGARVLRIEAFAEGFYALSIVGFGVCAGAGDTMVPTILNLGSMWVVRIGLALLLTPTLGLVGYWIAMAIDLTVKGVAFLIYVRSGRWLRRSISG
ncbi:MAG: MATE family efflux transporter [Bacteroidales bacterium]|nr:MATE family efflux transporter [Bacteroidales bacterium]